MTSQLQKTNRYNTNSKLFQLKLRIWSGLMAAISFLSKNCILYCSFWLKKFSALILTIAIVSLINSQNESYYRIDGSEFTFMNIPYSGLGFIAGLIGIRLSYFNHDRQTNCVRTAFNTLVCEIQRYFPSWREILIKSLVRYHHVGYVDWFWFYLLVGN